jgi:hypothetical protein
MRSIASTAGGGALACHRLRAPRLTRPTRSTDPHPIHLVEELALARAFGRQIQSQISLFHSRVVAVILKFGNYRVRDLCTPPELFEGIFTVKTEKV